MSTAATVHLPTCHGTGLPLPSDQWGTYAKATTEVLQRHVSSTPDGTSSVHVLLAGTCCSARCAIMFLAKHDPNTAGADSLQLLASLLPQGPCQLADDERARRIGTAAGNAEEPF